MAKEKTFPPNKALAGSSCIGLALPPFTLPRKNQWQRQASAAPALDIAHMGYLAIRVGAPSTVEKSPAKYRLSPCATMLLLRPKRVRACVRACERASERACVCNASGLCIL